MQRDDYRATLIVMFGLGAANLTGFVRQAVMAHELGSGRAADVFLVAFALPEIAFVALPIVLSPVFIPLFADCRLRAGEAGAWRFGLSVAGALLALLLVFTALVGFGVPLTLPWLAPGLDPPARRQAAAATRLMVPAISLMGLATLAGAALQVYRRFARPALATAVYNMAFVATLLVAPRSGSVEWAAWGVTLGALAALGFQLSLLWKHRPQTPVALWQALSERERTPLPASVGQAACLAGPLAAGYAVHHVILLVDRAMATALGGGSAAALNYAYHLALVIGQLSGLAVSTALFPHLAEQVAGNCISGMRASLADALRFVWTIGLPAACGLILLRTPLVRLLFEHGAFSPAATGAVTGPLVWYSVSVLGDALCQPLWRLIYAQRSPWSVLGVNGLQTGLRLLGNLALTPSLGHSGLALSAAVGLWVQAAVLGWLVWRRLGAVVTRDGWRAAARVTLATAAAGAAVQLLIGQLSSMSPAAKLLFGGALGGLVYLCALKSLEMRAMQCTPQTAPLATPWRTLHNGTGTDDEDKD